jgi:signal transduction histidine kinase
VLERVLETVPAGVLLVDTRGRITFANAFVRRRLALPERDLLQLSYDSRHWHVLDYDGNPVAADQLPAAQVLRTGKPVHAARLAVEYAGEKAFISLYAAPLFNADGSPDSVLIVFEDVSEQVRSAQRAQRHAEELEFLSRTAMGFMELPPDADIHRYIGDRLCEIVGDAIVVVASHEEPGWFQVRFIRGLGRKLDAVARLIGIQPERLRVRAHPESVRAMTRGRLTQLQLGIHQITSGLIPKPVAEALHRLVGWGDLHVMGFTRGAHHLGTVSILTPPGASIGSPALVEAFINQAAVAIERRQSQERLRETEEQLVQSQKLEAVGRLAGGLAHDFNNLLAVIMASANLLKFKAGDRTELAEHARMIEREAARGSELVRQLLGFARGGRFDRMPVDVHALIEELVTMFGHTVDPTISISRRLNAEHAVVQGDPGQLEQVLLNLAVNACDAMPEGGRLTFSTRTLVLDEESCRSRDPLSPGCYLVASVSDTGVGIPEHLRTQIYEPFFTTKEAGSGTGMGLATSYGIVKRHGGLLEVESEEGHGSTFHLYLPLMADSVSVARPAQTPTELPRGSGTVLVADDEPAVCRALAGMLQVLGYEVRVVHDGRQAVDYYRQHGAETDLVILDVKMPVMDGVKCFSALRELDPQVRVLVSSGHAAGGLAEQLVGDGARGCLRKPYSLSQLAEAVASALRS